MQQSARTSPQLTVAEALVLQDPNKAQGRAALKLTMMDLLARRVMMLSQEEHKGKLGITRKKDYVRINQAAAREFARTPHVQALIDAITTANKDGTPATMQQVVASARKQFGTDLERFQSNYVLPRLVEQGLLITAKKKVLLVFSSTRYEHTEAGQAALQHIQAQVAQARGIPALLDQNKPAEIMALVAGLGGAMLLVDELRPLYGRLSQTLRTQTAGGDSGLIATDTSGPDRDDQDAGQSDSSSDLSTGFDSFDFGDFNLDAFDTLDSSLDTFDSSFDSSADSGGSDGGDGGGSSD